MEKIRLAILGATWAGRQGLELYLQEYKGMFK